MRLNRNAECRRRRRVHRQQIEKSAEVICRANTERELYTNVFLKQREDRISVLERESHVAQPRVSASKHETRILPAPKREICVLLAPKREIRVLRVPERDSHVSIPKAMFAF